MERSSTTEKPFSIILFDLGNVLIRVDYPAFLRSLGFDDEMTERELYELLEEDSGAYESGRVTGEKYLGAFNAKLRTSYSFDQFQRAWNSILPEVIPGMSELVENLSSKYRLMVLSNTNELHFHHMIGLLPFLKRLERCFLSYEIGALKPDSAIYQHVLSHVDAPARQLLFIDDLEQNVQAARDVEMSAIVFQEAESLKKHLKRLKVI